MNTKHKFHNPDNLTPEQIGEGYRLLLKSEIIERPVCGDIEPWSGKKWDKSRCYSGSSWGVTYRVPLYTWPLPPVKSPEVAEPQLTYHQWRGKPARESPPTDNDAWECLLRTNADLGREVSELKKQRDALSSQLQGVITACHLRGYNVGDSLGEWIEKQFEDAEAKLKAAEARLAQLEWVPFSERLPSRSDGDSRGFVLTTNNKAHFLMRYNDTPEASTHWRPFSPPASIDTDRVEFEKFIQERGDGYMPNTLDELFDLWKAARKEVKL